MEERAVLMIKDESQGVQEQVMRAVCDHLQEEAAAPIDAARIAQCLGRSPTEIARCLRRCAREGLVIIEEWVGQDNPAVLRLTILGRQWMQRRLAT
jgi:AraC-like DNA-binding protein